MLSSKTSGTISAFCALSAIRLGALQLKKFKPHTVDWAEVEIWNFLLWEEHMSLNPKQSCGRRILLRWTLALAVVALIAPYDYADQIPAGWEASNMTPIGYSDLG